MVISNNASLGLGGQYFESWTNALSNFVNKKRGSFIVIHDEKELFHQETLLKLFLICFFYKFFKINKLLIIITFANFKLGRNLSIGDINQPKIP